MWGGGLLKHRIGLGLKTIKTLEQNVAGSLGQAGEKPFVFGAPENAGTLLIKDLVEQHGWDFVKALRANETSEMRLHGGEIFLDGIPVRYRLPRSTMKDGIVYVTEDRKAEGFFEQKSIAENITLGDLAATSDRSGEVARCSRRSRRAPKGCVAGTTIS